MREENKPELYTIPHNYEDSGGLLRGIFKLRNIIEGLILAVAVGSLVWMLVRNTQLPMIFKCLIVFLIGLILLLTGAFGMNGEPLSSFLIYTLMYGKSRRKLAYGEVRNNGTGKTSSKKAGKSQNKETPKAG